MDAPTTFPVVIGEDTLHLPVVALRGAPIKIALADTLGDLPVCDLLVSRLLHRAKERGVDLASVDVILTAGKAVTLADALARRMGIPQLAVAEKKQKSFWPEAYAVPSRSITGGQTEELTIGGRRAELIRGKRILVIDDVISTGESIHALVQMGEHFGDVVLVMAPFVEGDQGAVVTEVQGRPAVTLAFLPVWGADE